MMPEDIVRFVSNGENEINAYLAHPSEPKGPAVVLLSDFISLDSWIKITADTFAANGYLTFAPDLFRHCHARSNLVVDQIQELGYWQALRSYSKLDQDSTLRKLSFIFKKIKSHPVCNGKIAVIGFSIGGTFSFLAAARLNPDAAISFYAPYIHKHLKEGKNINCQTILHMGKNDQYMGKENTRKIHASLIGKFNIAIYQYQASRGFANPKNRELFNHEATTISFQRTFDLLGSLG